MMPVPVIASPLADIENFKQSLHSLHEFNLETIVQGHGDILLRGEVTPSIEESIQYLNDVEALVDRLIADGAARRELLSPRYRRVRSVAASPWADSSRISTKRILSSSGKRPKLPRRGSLSQHNAQAPLKDFRSCPRFPSAGPLFVIHPSLSAGGTFKVRKNCVLTPTDGRKILRNKAELT